MASLKVILRNGVWSLIPISPHAATRSFSTVELSINKKLIHISPKINEKNAPIEQTDVLDILVRHEGHFQIDLTRNKRYFGDV